MSSEKNGTNPQPSSNGNGNSLNAGHFKQARLQVSRLLKSTEGVEAIREGLLGTVPGKELVQREFGITVVDRKLEDSKPIVAILVPTHKEPQPETGNALQRMIHNEATKEGCHVILRPSVGSSVVHWCRNYLLAQLYKAGTPFDYVLFMDDDMTPAPEALAVLLDRKVDIVAAVCTVRQDPPLPNVRHYSPIAKCYQTADIDRQGIWNVGAVGSGFILISKKALDAIGEYTLSQRYWKDFMGMSQEKAEAREAAERNRAKTDHNQFWFEFLKDTNAGELGEDISFCLKARECGFDIYADSTVIVGHIGNYAFNLEDYWAYRDMAVQKGLVIPLPAELGQQSEQMLEVVEG